MGDRAIVHFTNGEDMSPAVYLHWGGSDIPKLLQETQRLMIGRPNDALYSCARFIGICHSHDQESNVSLGVWNSDRGDIFTENYSHGDAGVFVVDCSAEEWVVKCFGGYGFDYRGEGDYPPAKNPAEVIIK